MWNKPILCRYRRYMAHISNPPTRPLFRACGRFLYLHVERSIRSNRTSRTNRAGNIKEHSDQHQRVQALPDPERPGTGQELQKELSNRASVPKASMSPVCSTLPSKWPTSITETAEKTRDAGARFLLKPLVSLFDRVLFTKVRENFGGQLKFFIGGGALLDKDLQKFYYAIGLPMYQGYGLSEATPVISTNGPHRHTFGSSGVLVRPLDLKICDADGKELPAGEKGEIVIRGENVMAGYWKNPVSTAETVRNGWLYTGDMGYMGHDGLLYVLGRFKSLLIGSDGEKYSPEGIEEALVEHSSCIDQLILYNNQSPYTVALVVPNKDRLKKHLAHQHLDLSSDKGREEAIRIIQSQIDRFRKGGDLSALFPDRWLPAAFAILPEPFTEQNGMVNSTMKIVRGKVEKAYASRIDHLYTPEGKNPLNEENKKALD